MALSADAFLSASKPRRASCTVAKILGELDAKDRDVLLVALADPAVTSSAIDRVLNANGFQVAQHTIGRHRRGGCSCDR